MKNSSIWYGSLVVLAGCASNVSGTTANRIENLAMSSTETQIEGISEVRKDFARELQTYFTSEELEILNIVFSDDEFSKAYLRYCNGSSGDDERELLIMAKCVIDADAVEVFQKLCSSDFETGIEQYFNEKINTSKSSIEDTSYWIEQRAEEMSALNMTTEGI